MDGWGNGVLLHRLLYHVRVMLARMLFVAGYGAGAE